MNKILIVGPAWVGDLIMAQSLFRALKQLDPTVRIDVVAPAWSQPLLERMPEVTQSRVLPIDHGLLKLKTRYELAQRLKPEHYTQAIVLPNSWKSALIPWLAKIPKRSGWRGECRYGLLNDIRTLNKQQFPRMIDRFGALAYPKGTPLSSMTIPHPRLQTKAEDVLTALNKFSIQSIQTSNRPILALCPGAEFGPSKRWPTEYYSQIAKEKCQAGWSVLLFGSKRDQSITQIIQQDTNHQCIDLAGHTSLGEALDLLSLATAVVTNDSGLMHMAAALEKPLIALYGSTDPSFTPPLNSTARILRLNLACSPCFKRECPLKHNRCMTELLPAQVLTALNTLTGT